MNSKDRLPHESANIKPCPHLYEFQLMDHSTQRMTQVRLKVLCSKVKGHDGPCAVLNPNNNQTIYVWPEFDEELPSKYFEVQ